MSDDQIDELGPIDYLVVEFPADRANFTGEMAEALAQLVDAGVIRILDLLVLRKNGDGSVAAFEIDEVDELDALRTFEASIAELLAEDDVQHLADAMQEDSTAAVLVWENTWAAPFASAARRAGGQLIANGRIPIQAILASIEAEPSADNESGA